MSEYSVSIHISWGNPLCFLYPIEKAQLLQAALDHSVFRFHAYFFLCSITPASSARKTHTLHAIEAKCAVTISRL